MRFNRDLRKLSVIGLVVLAVLAVVLSAAALLSTRTVPAEPADNGASVAPSTPASDEASDEPSEDPSSEAPASEVPSEEPTSEEPSPEPTESDTPATGGNSVVVIGDSYSLDDDSWVATAADELGWGEVVNLSSPGRGFLSDPRSCDFEPCARFGGTVDAIAGADPDIVVTFGGTADGDYALDDAPSNYFRALRDALPEAELVALNPITGDSTAPYWLTLHAQNIRAAVEAVDGTFVNIGQPGTGDGDTLTAETQGEIAQAVVDALS